MKQFCVLISFVVANVFAVELEDYINEVAITNRQIELVKSSTEVNLRELITKIVCENTSMEKISIMVAAPDMVINVNGEIPEKRRRSDIVIDENVDIIEEQLQNSIHTSIDKFASALDRLSTGIANLKAGNEDIDNSGVEDEKWDYSDDTDDTVESIGDFDVNDEILNIDENSEISEEKLQRFIDYQTDMQRVIAMVLGIGDSDVKDKGIDDPDVKGKSIDDSDVKDKSALRTALNQIRAECESMGFECCNLSKLSEEVEKLFDPHCKACIASKLSELGIERKALISKVVQALFGDVTHYGACMFSNLGNETRDRVSREIEKVICDVKLTDIQNPDVKHKNIDNPDVKDENIDNPEVKDEITDIDVSDVKNKNCKACMVCKLSELGIERRNLFAKVVQDLFHDVTHTRISDDTDESEGDDDFKKSDQICRLRGLHKSILHPENFIVKAEVIGYTCYLRDVYNVTYTWGI